MLEDVHLMALTIMYTVGDKSNGGISVAFQPIVTRLITDKNMGRLIIFSEPMKM